MFQTKREIAALLESAGLAPRRRYGQHFLIDRNLMERLVSSAELARTDVALEVGAGTGSLTSLLAARCGAVVAVEVDRGLHAIAAEQLRRWRQDNVEVIRADALASKSRIEPRIIEALAQRQRLCGGRQVLVANLPYDAASPLLMDLVVNHPQVSPLCVTVQKELAERLGARTGQSAYGSMSVVVQAVAEVRHVANVPRQAFWPVPKVDSVMLRIDVSGPKRSRLGDVSAFAVVVRRLFGQRRKTLRQNIRANYPAGVAAAVQASGQIDLESRPEALSVEQWIQLVEAIRLAGGLSG